MVTSWFPRMRIEERLKLDEKLRQEENRAQQQHLMKLEVHHKSGKIDHKPGKEIAGDGGKSFGKHDPTTSYLSTYMPKSNTVSFHLFSMKTCLQFCFGANFMC